MSAAIRPGLQMLRAHDGIGLAATCTTTYAGRSPQVTVVYVHGLLSSAAAWSSVIAEVAPRLSGLADHLVFDHRGHGQSMWPARRSITTLSVLSADLATVLTHVGGPVVLVGHSLGTMAIQHFAEHHRGQFFGQVRGVALVNPAAHAPVSSGGLQRFAAVSSALRRLRGGPLDSINAVGHTVLQRLYRARSVKPDPHGSDHADTSGLGDPRVLADFLNVLGEFAATPQSAAALAGVPVRLVAGEHDRVMPIGQGYQLAATIPGSRVHVVSDAGHALPTTHPAECGRVVVELIQSLTPRARPDGSARDIASVGRHADEL